MPTHAPTSRTPRTHPAGMGLFTVALLLTTAAVGAPEAPTPRADAPTPPAAAEGGTAAKPASPADVLAIRFGGVMLRVPTGTLVGRYVGEPLYWQPSQFTAGGRELSEQAADALRRGGMPVFGFERRLFAEPPAATPLLMVVGELVQVHYRISTEGGKPGPSKARVTIRWSLYEPRRDAVLLTRQTTGRASAARPTFDLLGPATADAATAVVKDITWNATWRRVHHELVETARVPDEAEPIALPPADSPPDLPAEMPRALAAVVTVRAGDGHGSGVIVSPEGHVLTAAHVVDRAETVSVKLGAGPALEAQVLRVHRERDVALLRVAGREYPNLPLATAPTPVGHGLYVMGSPLSEALSASVSRGVVSGIRRLGTHTLLQTDARINPGNSGGPLVDERGRVIGIVTSKVIGDAIEGVAFAVPIADVRAALRLTVRETKVE